MEKKSKYVGAVITVLAGIVGVYAGQTLINNYMQGKNGRAIEQGQALAAAELRSQLPLKLDDVTTLQNVISMGPTLNYHYVVAANKEDVDLSVFAEQMQVQLKANTCDHASMAETIKYGGEYNYIYMSADGLRLGEFRFGKKECGFT